MHEIKVRPGWVIRIYLEEYCGRMYCHIRHYFHDQEGEFVPSKKGVTFYPDHLDQMIKALEA